MCRVLHKTLNILDDLALCSDNNDNARAQMMLLRPQINYILFYFYFILLASPDKEFINTYYSLYKVA